jgi:hypothetical protein
MLVSLLLTWYQSYGLPSSSNSNPNSHWSFARCLTDPDPCAARRRASPPVASSWIPIYLSSAIPLPGCRLDPVWSHLARPCALLRMIRRALHRAAPLTTDLCPICAPPSLTACPVSIPCLCRSPDLPGSGSLGSDRHSPSRLGPDPIRASRLDLPHELLLPP